MRTLILLTAFTLVCSATFAETKKRGEGYARRDLSLEKRALSQRKKIDEMLPPWAKQKLNIVFKEFLDRVLGDEEPGNVSAIVREELEQEFKELSPEQSNVLSFYVVSGVLKLIPPHAERSDTSSERESIGELTEMDMLMLQQMMEKKNQLESMISNCMRAGLEGGQAAIEALKAS